MADELTREEAAEKLEAIYRGTLEGADLEKRVANIPRALDKYEGKWPKIIKAAEKKYGKPETDETDESEEKPTKKKRGGMFSRLGKSKKEAEPSEADDPDDSEEAVEEPTDEPEEATDDEQADEEHDDAADLEGDEAPLEKAARLLEGGDSEGALEVWKGLVRSDGGNPEVWRGLASYFASAGRPGRAQACEEHADELP